MAKGRKEEKGKAKAVAKEAMASRTIGKAGKKIMATKEIGGRRTKRKEERTRTRRRKETSDIGSLAEIGT